WVRTAVLSAPAGVAGPIFRMIVADGRDLSNESSLALLHGLAGIVGASGDTRAAARLLDDLAESPVARERYYRLEEALVGLAEGLARAGGKMLRDALASTRSPRAREMLDAALRRAEVTAADSGADLDRRERAAALIGQAGFATAGRVLAA